MTQLGSPTRDSRAALECCPLHFHIFTFSHRRLRFVLVEWTWYLVPGYLVPVDGLIESGDNGSARNLVCRSALERLSQLFRNCLIPTISCGQLLLFHKVGVADEYKLVIVHN